MSERTERDEAWPTASATMTLEQAAQLIARESWPGERWENRRAWAPRLIADPGMAEEEVAHALARIEQRRVNVLAAAAVLAVDAVVTDPPTRADRRHR
jgi:hypothetical protein